MSDSAIKRIMFIFTWQYLRSVSMWIWGTRPVSLPVLLVATHFSAHAVGNVDPTQLSVIDAVLKAGLPVLGGFLILRSLNSSLKLFNNSSLFDLAKSYAQKFPNRMSEVSKGLVVLFETADSATIKGRAHRHDGTIEGRLESLTLRLDALERECDAEDRQTKAAILSLREQLGRKIESNQHEVESLKKNLGDATRSSGSDQVMGFLLATHAALANAFL